MDITQFFSYFIGLGLLLLCSAFFSGSETALSALTRPQLQRIRRKTKGRNNAVVRFMDDPRRLFITVLFGNTLVNMAFITITGALIYDKIFQGKHPAAASVTAIFLETMLLLIFGEITPKTLAIKNAESFSRRAAPPLWTFSRIIYPFRKMLRFITDIFLPLFGVRSMVDTKPVTSEEIRAAVRATAEGGAIDEQEGEILSNIFDLPDTKVTEIMVPRTKMVCVEVSSTIQEAFTRGKAEGYSRLPIYRKHLDNICGIFNVKDLPRWNKINTDRLGKHGVRDLTLDEFLAHQDMLHMINPGQENTLVRPPFFVYKRRDIGSLLREMTHKKQRVALLLDEFGGVVGMATTEDIVEEVVGEIEDEYDEIPEKKVMPDPDQPACYLVKGDTGLRALNRHLGLNLDIGIADTVNGYVTFLAGTIPQAGDTLEDKPHGLIFEVLEMAGNRIARVRIGRVGDGSHGPSTMMGLWGGVIGLMGISTAASVSGGGSHVNDVALIAFVVLLIFSLAMTAFFAGSETSVVSASPARIEILAQQSDKRALFIRQWRRDPARMLGTVLVGTNLMETAAGVAGLQLLRWIIPDKAGVQGLINTLVMTFILLIFCEILPKTVFRARADALALRSAPLLRFSDVVLRPSVAAVNFISQKLVRLNRGEEEVGQARIMREELVLLAEMGEEGAQKKAQLRMVQGILDMEERTIAKIMTPLVEIVAIEEDAHPDDFFRKVVESGYSRIPVFRDRIDNIVGLVNVLDVLYAESPAESLEPFIRRRIRHEPESRRVFPLLQELTQSRSPMLFVVDEYGGVVGLVTIEDLVEEVMGDIRDERDLEPQQGIHRISEHVLDCDGKTEVQVLNHDYDLSISEGDYVTIAGFVIEKLQKIPRKGENLVSGRMKVLVLDADAKSVRRVRITKK